MLHGRALPASDTVKNYIRNRCRKQRHGYILPDVQCSPDVDNRHSMLRLMSLFAHIPVSISYTSRQIWYVPQASTTSSVESTRIRWGPSTTLGAFIDFGCCDCSCSCDPWSDFEVDGSGEGPCEDSVEEDIEGEGNPSSLRSRGCGSVETDVCKSRNARSSWRILVFMVSIWSCSSSVFASTNLFPLPGVKTPKHVEKGRVSDAERGLKRSHSPSGQIAAHPRDSHFSHGTYTKV